MSDNDSELNSLIEHVDLEGLTYRQLLNMLSEQNELILTLDKTDVASCKKNLTALKSRDRSKLKDAGIEAANDTLRYTEIAIPGNQELVKLHIVLGERPMVKVHKIEVPDDEL